MGAERIRRHWRELVARWAAYPVVFCVAGEVNLAGYEKDLTRASATHAGPAARDLDRHRA